jgi:hypothetical protein
MQGHTVRGRPEYRPRVPVWTRLPNDPPLGDLQLYAKHVEQLSMRLTLNVCILLSVVTSD